IRQPKHSTSGFYADQAGTVVTTLSGVEQCQRITINGTYDMELIASDAATGLAALGPQETLVPAATATFQSATPRLQSEIAVAGFSYGGILDAATLTFGRLADLRGLRGE